MHFKCIILLNNTEFALSAINNMANMCSGVKAGAVRRSVCPGSMQLTRRSVTVISSSPAYLLLIPIEVYCKGDSMRRGTYLTVTPVSNKRRSLINAGGMAVLKK